MITPADKLNEVKEYYFATKLREVKSLINQGKPIINAGIGSPDLQPPDAVTQALVDSLSDKTAHQYQSYLGLPELREAMSDFYNHHYSVKLDPASEVIPLMGSKEGILHTSMAFLNKGDAVLVPNPGYPTYSSATRLCEATPIYYDLKQDNDWMPDIEELEAQDLENVKIMWVNYPHMPTGVSANDGVFERLIAFGKKHDVLIINDNPYSFLGYDTKASIHQSTSSRDAAVLELNSVSKTFNMAGWRVGMLTGNAALIKEVLKVKTNMDSGMFYPVQKGAIAALKTDESWFLEQQEIYEERRAKMMDVAQALGCKPIPQEGGLFVFCKLPSGVDDKEFVDDLLHKYNIFIAPGSIFGSNGEAYVRFSLCVKLDDIQLMLERVTNKTEL